MKKYIFYIGLIIAALLITSCKKDDADPTSEIWKQWNEQAFNDLSQNPDFTELWIEGNRVNSIYYRVIQKGEGKRLFYNSRAEIYFKGWYVVTHADINIKEGDVFDQQLFDDGVTWKVAVSAQSMDANYVYVYENEGWKVALQHMVEGDIWEIRIPYQLGYGSLDQKTRYGYGRTVFAYSTLAFEIEVVKAIDPDEF